MELKRATEEFAAALEGLPFGQGRIESGQQFNCYESADNDEGGEPDDWEFWLSLGPVTNHIAIARIDGEWRAKLIESALRVALAVHRQDRADTAQIEALRAENAALKDKALGFIAVWATHYAQGQGYPDGHLHPTHFDLLAEFGGNTAHFTRATLAAKDNSACRWAYIGTDYHGSRKDEDLYKCEACGVVAYEDDRADRCPRAAKDNSDA